MIFYFHKSKNIEWGIPKSPRLWIYGKNADTNQTSWDIMIPRNPHVSPISTPWNSLKEKPAAPQRFDGKNIGSMIRVIEVPETM